MFDTQHLLEASNALKYAEILCGDFEEILAQAVSGDFTYDPPYVSSQANTGFSKYNADTFTWHDQQRLARTAMALADRGCHVLVSNTRDALNRFPIGGYDRGITRRGVRRDAGHLFGLQPRNARHASPGAHGTLIPWEQLEGLYYPTAGRSAPVRTVGDAADSLRACSTT